MQLNILWSGRAYYSMENCLLNFNDGGVDAVSTIVGRYDEKIYKVEYHIKTNNNWETIFCELHTQHDNYRDHLMLELDAEGNWIKNGKPAPEFKGCMDVDIPVTPFTNTLPINRLKPAIGSVQIISVMYLDVLKRQSELVRQKYQRISANKYHYENIPNDFEADITIDEFGLVVDYPLLFSRTAMLKTGYK